MSSSEAPPVRFLLEQVYNPGLLNEHRITNDVIGAIPLDKGDYRPEGISKSALDLAWHMVATEAVFMEAIANGEFRFSPQPRPESIRTSADLISWSQASFRKNFDALQTLSDEQLGKVIDFRGMFQMPAVMYLGFLLHHTVHHRGQLSMYLRPMGAKVPAIYGESYDSAEARKSS
jgi:uncharacterized damage-inducible protein DinB